jgi:D-alanyl-D-alanine carboxypeptidase
MPWPLYTAHSVGVGYEGGAAIAVPLVTVQGLPVRVETASAFLAMADAAARDGLDLRLVSAFRTMDEQVSLHRRHLAGGYPFVATPGYSGHQRGTALDIDTAPPGVAAWLEANARRHGFARTIAGEPWHWELLPAGR